MKKIYFYYITLAALISGIVFTGVSYWNTREELLITQRALASRTIQTKTIDFMKLFITEVLNAKEEIDFETRLKLETAVRDLNDEQVLAAWNSFTGSQSEEEAQERVKQLLQLLVNKSRAA